MRVWATGANILNLGSDALGRMPVPMRPRYEQDEVISACESLQQCHEEALVMVRRSAALWEERKRSLITAAVTGEFDVSTASSRAADVAVSGVGGGV